MISPKVLTAFVCAAIFAAQPAKSTELIADMIITLKSDVGTDVHYKIVSEQFDPIDIEKKIPLYTINIKIDQNWVPLCHPDVEGRRTAIPLNGRWDLNGNFENSIYLTFACTAGVIAKCILWGYAPWKISIGGQTMREMHQTCTRMARADYCGNGKSYTRNGTPINIYDKLSIQEHAPRAGDNGPMYEAAWGPEGATEIVHTRWGEPLEDIVAECPEKNWIFKSNPRRIVLPNSNPILFNDSRQQ